MNKKGNIVVGVFAGIIFIIALIFLSSGFDKVEANHLGVKVRLGKITGTMHPGISWTGPMTDVVQYNMRMRKAKVEMLGLQSAADKDGQAVYGEVSVNYRIKNSIDVIRFSIDYINTTHIKIFGVY